MLYVPSELKDRLEKALQFAHRIDKEHTLLAQLYRLGQGFHNNGNQYICFLYSDFAPHSFGFAFYDLNDCEITQDQELTIITKKYAVEPWMHGGLIYHGPLENGEESESFSVQLTKHDGWSIHT